LGYDGIWRRQDHNPAEALSASGVGKVVKECKAAYSSFEIRLIRLAAFNSVVTS